LTDVKPQAAPAGVAITIADRVRTQILSGELPDGSSMPPLEQLMRDFAASKLSIRQGLQILESEGLLTVRRGRLGGSVVHRPDSVTPGRAIAGALLDAAVSAEDMTEALSEVEPVCAGLCARRADRLVEVVPHLRRVHELGRAAVDGDPDAWPERGRLFHEELVARCGNETLVLLMGAVESVCTMRAAGWLSAGIEDPDFPTRNDAYRRRGLADHELILTFIERGDSEAAAREAGRHLQWLPTYPVAERPGPDLGRFHAVVND
jgi:GntR family transcriptional repressor for pyruvate dehydrogenase complex